MIDFPCSNCRATISVNDDERGLNCVCYVCNARQVVPIEAAVAGAVDEPPAFRFFNRIESSNAPPKYQLANTIGVLLIVGGAALAVFTIISMLSPNGVTPVMTLWGLAVTGIGVIIHLLREMAIDLWHLRYRKN